MIYILTTPLNTLELKGRALGNYPAHFNAAARKALRQTCEALKAKGIQHVYASDMDADALHIVADELHAPASQEYGLRKFNIGRQHGAKLDHVRGILEQLVPKWGSNDSIPIRGGDSWRSVEKRLFKTFDTLMGGEEVSVVITDAATATLLQMRTAKALTVNGAGCSPGKVYMVNHAGAN